MEVTCPNCGARYAVDPLAIGPAGRTVQCARCSHRWFETIKAAPAASPSPRPAERPVPDFVIRPQSHYSAGLPAISAAAPDSPLGPMDRRPSWWCSGGVRCRRLAREIRTGCLPGARCASTPARRRRAAPRRSGRSSRPASPRDRPRQQQGRTRRWPLLVRGELLNSGRTAGSTSMLKLVFRKGDDVLGERAYP